MPKTSFKPALLASSAIATALISFSAAAQTAQPAPKPALTEVTVTATRVRTSAQKTPIALTVYSPEKLTQNGVHSVLALTAIDPSINVQTSNGSSSVGVRGVASTDRTEIGDPAVPIARDGFFTDRSYLVDSSLYDVSRIEVLKGPQGTLFGRNSTGGLISVITNKPNFEAFGGYVNVEAGNYATINTEGALNLPFNDKLAFRVSAMEQHHDGYAPESNGQKGDDANLQSMRLQMAVKPLEGLSANVAYQLDHVNDVGDVSFNAPIGQVPDIKSSTSGFVAYAPQYNRLNGHRVTWDISYSNLPMGMTLTYDGGEDVEQWRHALDATDPYWFNNSIYGYEGPGHFPGAQQFVQAENPTTWNHEIRLSNDPSARWTYQVGMFHFSENNFLTSGIRDYSMVPGWFGPSTVGEYGILFTYPRVFAQSNGYFGQTSFKLNDQWKVTGGWRYTEDEKQRLGYSQINLAALVSPFIPSFANPPPTNGGGDSHDARPTYLFDVDYTPTPDTLIYAKYATGYKAGGFNNNGAAPPVPYGPETLASYEIGTKNWFLDRTVQFNLDGFYEDYNGYQASQFTGALSSGSGVFNVGSAKIYGAEVQGIYLSSLGRFDLNATFLNTRMGAGIKVANGATPPVEFDIGGNELPNAAPVAISAGFEHNFDLSNGATVTPRVDVKYTSQYYFDVFNTADTRAPATTTVNFNLAYEPENAKWKLAAYVRNLTNAVVWTYATANYDSNENNYEFAPPRTFGVQGSYKF